MRSRGDGAEPGPARARTAPRSCPGRQGPADAVRGHRRSGIDSEPGSARPRRLGRHEATPRERSGPAGGPGPVRNGISKPATAAAARRLCATDSGASTGAGTRGGVLAEAGPPEAKGTSAHARARGSCAAGPGAKRCPPAAIGRSSQRGLAAAWTGRERTGILMPVYGAAAACGRLCATAPPPRPSRDMHLFLYQQGHY